MAYVLTNNSNEGVDAVFDKIQNLEYVDIAENAIKVLEKISIESPGALLSGEGINMMLNFIDFFMEGTQVRPSFSPFRVKSPFVENLACHIIECHEINWRLGLLQPVRSPFAASIISAIVFSRRQVSYWDNHCFSDHGPFMSHVWGRLACQKEFS